MGRKIPSKKHKGVKDPLVQQAKRLQDLKGKINAPPNDPDEQPVPRSLTQLFAFQNRSTRKNWDTKIKKKPIKGKNAVTSNHTNPIASLQKLPGESGRGFSLRINSAVKALHDTTLQQDYPQDIDAEDAKGERMAFQRERRKKKQKKKSDTGGEQDRAPKLSRGQKLALKKREKMKKAIEDKERERECEVRYERVSFGEVAHAPPALPPPPRRAARAPGAPRPGRRELLLSAMMSDGAGGGGGGGAPGRRRPPPAAELERRERARLEAVAAYRALKRAPRLRADRRPL